MEKDSPEEVLNYHEIISEELRVQNKIRRGTFESIIGVLFKDGAQIEAELKEMRAVEPENKESKIIDSFKPKPNMFEPNTEQWSDAVRQHISLKPHVTDKGVKTYQISFSEAIESVYKTIRELQPWTLFQRNQFIRPTARREMPNWHALEKLVLLCILHHADSLPHIQKFVDVIVPNVKSSMGAQASSDPGNRGILESLKLLGT